VLGSLGPGKLYVLIEAYDVLVRAGGRLSAADVCAVLEAISARATGKAHTLRKRVWTDAESVHGVPRTEEIYRWMIVGCAKYGDVEEALRLAREVYDAGGALGEAEWAALGAAAGAAVSSTTRRRLIRETLEFAQAVQQNTDRTYAAALESLTATDRESTAKDFEDVLARMQADGVEAGPWVQIQLVASHLQRSELDAAKALTAAWARPDDVPDPKLARDMGRSLIAVEMAREDPEGVEAAIRSLPYGTDMSSAVFVYLVRNRLDGIHGAGDGKPLDADQLLQVVDDIARSVGRDPSQSAWARLVANVLAESNIETAFVVYQAARKRAPFMTADLARDLVAKLCAAKPPHFTQAMQVYDDLAATPTWEANRPKDTDASTALFSTLLRACDRAQPPVPGIAIELADIAKSRGILLPTQDIAHYIVDNMAVARDHPEAYDVYSHLSPLAQDPFTHRQYTHMLSNFIILDFPGSNVAPPDYVMNMLNDMRRAGHEPSAGIFTSLLTSYAKLSKKVTRHKRKLSASESEFALEALMNATNDVYRLVSLDPMLEVDLPLLVALMDALSSVNAFSDALEVWDDIVRRRALLMASAMPQAEIKAFYGPAISVALDTCGYAERPDRAKRIWAWGLRHDLLNRRAWPAYVECLARAGRYADALDVLTKDMPAAGLKPTLSEVSIPVKFSWRQPKSIAVVLARIQAGLPEYYDEVKKIVEVKQQQ
jgi:pentatricopeptide repeat protein